MNLHTVHPLRRWAAGGILGLLAVIMVAAVLGGALAAIRANNTIDGLAADLHDARGQIAQLQADNTRLGNQNRQILHQNRVLVRELRRHGLTVPERLLQLPPASAGGGGSTSPKAQPTAPPSPPHQHPHSTPTAKVTTGSTTPSTSPTGTATATPLDLLCQLSAVLCLPLG